MSKNETGKGQPAFLLAQLGAHAASQFAERLGVLELAPADAGILRLLRVAAGLSQQELAGKLQIHPSRLVAILDKLEKRGFVERRENPDDRRLYSIHLTRDGGEILQKIGRVAMEHQGAGGACRHVTPGRRPTGTCPWGASGISASGETQRIVEWENTK
jgi:DNA-binding MarR family transcriptional regulator